MNIKLIFAPAAALALIAGAPALAAAKSQDAQPAAGEGGGAKAKNERKTCRTYVSTQSRTKVHKLCLTREEWKKFDREQAEM